MTGWNHYRNPYNSVSWAEGVERAKVTLARIPGVEQGTSYVTVPLRLDHDARGDHMKRLVRRRSVRREGAI